MSENSDKQFESSSESNSDKNEELDGPLFHKLKFEYDL